MDRREIVPLECHQQRMLDPAGHAPGGEDIHDLRFTGLEIGRRKPERAPLHRRQIEFRHRFADQGGWNLARIERQADGKTDADQQE